MELTQTQIDTLNHNLRNKRVRIELLDDDFKTISTIEGSVVSGEITANAESDIRYSGNLTIAIPTYVNKSNFLVELQDYTISANGKIWLDKRVRIHIGVDNFTTNTTTWYNMGIYYIDQPTRTFSGTDYLVSFDIADQMIKLSGARQGQLTGISTTFEKGYYELGPQQIEYGASFSNGKLTFDTSFSGSIGTYPNTILTTSGGDVVRYVHGVLKQTWGGTIVSENGTGWSIVATKEYSYSIVFGASCNYCLKLDINGKTTARYDLGYDYVWSSAAYGAGKIVVVARADVLGGTGCQYGLCSTDDGETWTRFDFGSSGNLKWAQVIFSTAAGCFFAISNNSLQVWKSTDGITWSLFTTINTDSSITQLSCMSEITPAISHDAIARSYLLFFTSNSNLISWVYLTDPTQSGTLTLPISANWKNATSIPYRWLTGTGSTTTSSLIGAVFVIASGTSTAYTITVYDTSSSANLSMIYVAQDLGANQSWGKVIVTDTYSSLTGKTYYIVVQTSSASSTGDIKYCEVNFPTNKSSVVFGTWDNFTMPSITRGISRNLYTLTYNRKDRYDGFKFMFIGGYDIFRTTKNTEDDTFPTSVEGNILDLTPAQPIGMTYCLYSGTRIYPVVTNENEIIYYSNLTEGTRVTTSVTCPINGSILGVASDGTNLVVYSATQIYYSSNAAQSWTMKTLSGTSIRKILSIEYINNQFVALALSTGTTTNVCVSVSSSVTSSSTWNFVNIGTTSSTDINGFLRYANSTYIAITSRGSTNTSYTSTDGSTWTSHSLSINNAISSLTSSSDKFAVSTYNTNDGLVYYSTDGITWTQSSTSPTITISIYPKMIYFDDIFILWANNQIYYSFDLSIWYNFGESIYELSPTDGSVLMEILNNQLYVAYPNRKITRLLTSNGVYYNNDALITYNLDRSYYWHYGNGYQLSSTSGFVNYTNEDTIGTFTTYTTLNQSSYIKVKTEDALRTVITELAGITKYSIYPIPTKYEYLPYDIKVSVGATVLEILNKFKEILSTWQMYFDRASGYFIVEPIPSGENDIVYDIEERQLVQNDQSVDFQHVKNQVVVYGKLNTLSYYTDNETSAGSVSYSGTTLKLYYSLIDSGNLTIGGTLFGFKTPANYSPQINSVEIYSGGTLFCSGPIVDFEYVQGFVPENKMEPNEIYCIRIYNAGLNYDGTINILQNITFEFYSKQQVLWTLVNDNKDSPFYVNNNIKETNYYCGLSTSTNGSVYSLTLNDKLPTTSLADKTILTFMANQLNTSTTTISVYSSFSNTAIVSNAPLKQNYWTTSTTRPNLSAGKIYNDCTIHKIQYDATNNWFVYLGRNDKVITKVLSGGEYDNIYSDQLAYERCLYELYQYSNMQNTISLGLVPNYNLDVNKKIPYNEKFTNLDLEDYQNLVVQPDSNYIVQTSKQYKVQLEKEYYLTKTVTFPLGINNTPQNVTAIKIYNDKNLVGDDYTYITNN